MKNLLRASLAAVVAAIALGGAATVAMSDATPMPLMQQQATPNPQPGPGPDGGASMGFQAMVPEPPHIRHDNTKLLFEEYPGLAYTPFNIGGGGGGPAAIWSWFSDPAAQAMNTALNMSASGVEGFAVNVGVLCTRLLEWTFSMDVISGAQGPLGAVVRGLDQGLYQSLLPLVLGLVGITLVWHLLIRRRTTHGLLGAAWAVLAIVLAGIYLTWPAQVMSGVNDFSAGLSRQVLGTVASADPAMLQRSGNPALRNGPTDDAEIRLFADRWWQTYVYQPWTVATFGRLDPKAPNGDFYGVELLKKNSGQDNRFDADWQGADKAMQSWYAGDRAGDRLAIAIAALLTVLLAAVLYCVIAFTVVFAQLGLLILAMVAPLFLLAGVHYGVGRRLLFRWAELVVGALLIRVLYSTFLAVLIVVAGVLTQVFHAAGWWAGVALQLALVIAALIFRRPFLAIFAQAAKPRIGISHVGGPLPARAAHGALGRGHNRITGQPGLVPPSRGVTAIRASAKGGGQAAIAGKGAAAVKPVAARAGANGAKAVAGGAKAVSSGGGGGILGRAKGAVAALATPQGKVAAAAAVLRAGQGAVRAVDHGRHELQRRAGEAFLLGGGAAAARPKLVDAKRPAPLTEPVRGQAAVGRRQDWGKHKKARDAQRRAVNRGDGITLTDPSGVTVTIRAPQAARKAQAQAQTAQGQPEPPKIWTPTAPRNPRGGGG